MTPTLDIWKHCRNPQPQVPLGPHARPRASLLQSAHYKAQQPHCPHGARYLKSVDHAGLPYEAQPHDHDLWSSSPCSWRYVDLLYVYPILSRRHIEATYLKASLPVKTMPKAPTEQPTESSRKRWEQHIYLSMSVETMHMEYWIHNNKNNGRLNLKEDIVKALWPCLKKLQIALWKANVTPNMFMPSDPMNPFFNKHPMNPSFNKHNMYTLLNWF